MVAANEYLLDDEEPEEEEEGSGPVILGLAITSKVVGIAIGALGAILCGVGVFYLALPTWEEQQILNSNIQIKQREIEQQNEKLQQQEEAERQREEAKQRLASVTALFADEANLEMLMFDVNEQLNQINAGILDEELKARLVRFQPQSDGPMLVTDGSLGSQVNNKLRRQEYEVEVEGSFEQIRKFMISLERMQPMLVVRDFSSQLLDRSPELKGEIRQGRFVPIDNQPQRRLRSTFKLHALMPLSDEQREQQQQPEAEKKIMFWFTDNRAIALSTLNYGDRSFFGRMGVDKIAKM
ncbi:pilus assembly protein PilO [Limnospira indica]|nr:pilus assembly protein PilO [Limnospira indica]QNH57026.1 MAG: pilus assembly protein PilO [Limnospira indica BM01]